MLACEALAAKGIEEVATPMGEGLSLVSQEVTQDGVRDKGRYLTIKIADSKTWDEAVSHAVTDCLNRLLQANGVKPRHALVVGLGNRTLLCDRLGTATVEEMTPAERLWLLCPMVQTQSGMPTADIVGAITKAFRPDVVITIDALVCNTPRHLMRTVQLWDAGFRPGGGVGKTCKTLNRESLGATVLSVGVPTLSYVEPYDARLCVTTQDIEQQIGQIAALLANALQAALGGKRRKKR